MQIHAHGSAAPAPRDVLAASFAAITGALKITVPSTVPSQLAA